MVKNVKSEKVLQARHKVLQPQKGGATASKGGCYKRGLGCSGSLAQADELGAHLALEVVFRRAAALAGRVALGRGDEGLVLGVAAVLHDLGLFLGYDPARPLLREQEADTRDRAPVLHGFPLVSKRGMAVYVLVGLLKNLTAKVGVLLPQRRRRTHHFMKISK
uniref:ORF162 n=1 Tax=Desulfovibrio desulfuricans TaxID=876 RepID=Q06361_DESDE|nr:ORF162 [Desulfovibrio desulfuricans]